MVESSHNRFFQLPLLKEIPLTKDEKKSSLYLVYPELLSEELLKRFSNMLSDFINKDSHMLPILPQNIIDSVRQGLSVMVVDSEFLTPIGYAKFYPWKRERRSCWFRIRECICYTEISRLWSSKRIN